jgi:hypothetical protein
MLGFTAGVSDRIRSRRRRAGAAREGRNDQSVAAGALRGMSAHLWQAYL